MAHQESQHGRSFGEERRAAIMELLDREIGRAHV